MARDYHTHIEENKFLNSQTAPKHLSRQAFGRRLFSHMRAKGWTQAELARRAGILRDSVSNYVRGNSLPSPQNLLKIAKALGVEADDLLANYAEQAVQDDIEPPFDLKTSAADPSKAWLRVNRMVSFPAALKIAEILKDEDANNSANRK